MTSEVLPLPLARGTRRREADQTASLLERSGPEACSDEQLLALLLGSGDPARRLARRLIDRFGSLTDVVRAHPAELRIAGVGGPASLRITATAELGRRAARDWPVDPWAIRTPTDVAEPLIDAMGALDR